MPVYHPPCKCKSLFPDITENDLLQLQIELDSILPEDFVDFLRQWNGIVCLDKEFYVPVSGVDQEDFPIFSRMYGVDPGNSLETKKRYRDLRHAGEGYHFDKRVPSHFMAIGTGNSWDVLCMSLASADFGSIHFWMSGEPWPDEEEVASTDYIRIVADNFSEFWALLMIPVE